MQGQNKFNSSKLSDLSILERCEAEKRQAIASPSASEARFSNLQKIKNKNNKMLIIFDLDDTLIDTSDSLTPVKLRDAIVKMQAAGLQISSVDKAHQEILNINQQAKNGRDTIHQFCKFYQQPHLAQHGIREYYQNIDPNKVQIKLVHNAAELIETLAKEHTLAIVTHGIKDQQLQKIKSAKINTELFSNIYVTPLKNKGDYYQKLMDQYQKASQQTIVIGDNLLMDVMPAKNLGINAVHFRSGRGKHIEYNEKNNPSFSIKSLNEINDIVKLCKQ
jgi:putative hydrolase of the HAD superfamily